jgi:peptidyl-prolyl cis-trans isomerase C
MRKLTYSAALLLAGAIATCAAADQPAATNAAVPAPSKPLVDDTNLFPDTVVAKGKGVEVKRSQLDDEVVRIKSSLAGRGQTLPPEQMPMVEQSVLDRLIQMQLLLGKATDADKAKAKAETAKHFEEIRTNAPSDEVLDRRLKLAGMTRQGLLDKMTEEATAENVLERELKINVTAADIQKYYDANTAKFEEPEMVRASHILIGTRDSKTGTELSPEQKAAKRKLAEDLLKRARAGEDFAKLAKEYSEDPGSKDNGGEYKFPKGQMVPEFEAAAFALKTNEISDVVTTQFGFHIIKLSEKIPAQKVPLEKASAYIKNALTMQQLQEQAPAFFAKLRKDNNVEILDPKLKAPEDIFAAPADTNAAPAAASGSTNAPASK